MSWTDRADNEPCCPSSLGAVKPTETVARLTHSGMIRRAGVNDNTFDPFPRSEFFPPKRRIIDDECGNADGCSVIRSDHLSRPQINDRTLSLIAFLEARRAADPKREAMVALITNVGELRSIRISTLNAQIVFIYDDPKTDDPLHAVIRCSSDLNRPEQDFIREKIRQAFRSVSASQN